MNDTYENMMMFGFSESEAWARANEFELIKKHKTESQKHNDQLEDDYYKTLKEAGEII